MNEEIPFRQASHVFAAVASSIFPHLLPFLLLQLLSVETSSCSSMASIARPRLLPLLSALLLSFFFDPSASAAALSSSSLQQRRRLLQSSSATPGRNIETFFPSNAAPAFTNPPPPPPPLPPPPSSPPFVAPAPPPRSSSGVTVAEAVVATAASTFVVSGFLFFFLHRFTFKKRKVESYQGKFRGDGGGGAAARNPYRAPPVDGMLKAVVVDEEGLDVLYWRKLEDGNRRRCAHCKQVESGDDGGGGGGREGGRREQAGVRKPREEERRVQKTPLLPADSLSSSDRIRSVLSTESEHSSVPGAAISMNSAEDAAVPETRTAAPPSPPLPLPPGRRGPTSKSPSPASSTSPLPPPAATLRPLSPPSPKRLSAMAAAPPPPPPPQPPSAPPPPPPPPPPAKRTPAPPAPPPPRPPPTGNKNLGPTAPPPPPGAGRPVPSPSRPPTVPRSNSRSTAAEGAERENTKAPAKLKPLHWDKMTTANAQHSMVWDKISDGSFRFDDDLMEALFGYVATNRKSPQNGSSSSSLANPFGSAAAGAGAASAQICLLDPRKSQNTAIVLKSLAVTRQEILDALLEGRGLSADTLEKLSKLAPTEEEEVTILGFSANPSRLADAESFLFHLLRAIPSAFARVDAMLFKANYEPEVGHLRESLRALEDACSELRRQGLFWKMLEAVLKAGNRMNAGTARGNAQAFNLASLRKLSDVKSTDGKTTLLHFVVESVVRSEGKRCVVNRNHSFGRSASRSSATGASSPAPGAPTREEKEAEYTTLGLPVVGGLSAEFANVKKAAAVEYDALVGGCSALGARVAEARQLLAACGGGGGGFVKDMGGFLERAEGELKALREEQARVVELVRKTTEYYMVGTAQNKGSPPLQLFLIVKDFLGMVDQACVDIARNLQQQKRKAAPSGTGSPAAPQRRVPTRFPNLPAHFLSENSNSSSSGGGGSNSNSDSEDDGF